MQEIITKAVPTGVWIVTVRAGEKVNGMTAAWATQVSFKPRLIAVSIAPPRYTHGLIKESGYFCLNLLSKDQMELANLFGFKSGRKVDKFKGLKYTNALKGSPVLEDVIAYVECEVKDIVTAGDHDLFIGEVVDAAELKKDAEPMIFKWDDFFGKK